MSIFQTLPLRVEVVDGGGTDTSKDTVTAESLREGITAHDAAGQPITGTIPDYSGGNTVEMTSPEGATLNTAGTYCEGNIEVVPKLQSKTATTGEIVTADDGYVGLESVDTNPVFEAGRKAWMDSYIDARGTGNPTNMFSGPSWTNETYTPTKDLKNIYNAGSMYYNCGVTGSLEEIHQRCGVTLDLSMSISFDSCFAYSKLSGVCEVSCTRDGFDITTSRMFANAISLKRIAKFIATERTRYDNTFVNCTALTDLTVEGTIGQNGFNVQWSPLSHDSLMSILYALEDYSADTSGTAWVVTIGSENRAKLTEDEIAIAEEKGWEVK